MIGYVQCTICNSIEEMEVPLKILEDKISLRKGCKKCKVQNNEFNAWANNIGLFKNDKN